MEYFDDIEVGAVRHTASHTVTKGEIVAFAREFDPQPFHIDEAAAKAGPYGSVIASGWHTAAMMMRLIVDQFAGQVASAGSPGFDKLRWLKPVFPNDTLHVRSTCIDKAPSKSRPNLGTCKFTTEVLNQNDEVVMSLITIGLYTRRPN